jgi:hypothetical protein
MYVEVEEAGMKVTKALSVRAPWWWFILHAGKDIENRDWPTKFRGTVYVHASKWWSLAEIGQCVADAFFGCLKGDVLGVEVFRSKIDFGAMKLARGCIVGTVDIVRCVDRSDSPWFFGKHGFVLANPVAFAKPVPCKGMLGFFAVPDDVLAQIEGAR